MSSGIQEDTVHSFWGDDGAEASTATLKAHNPLPAALISSPRTLGLCRPGPCRNSGSSVALLALVSALSLLHV